MELDMSESVKESAWRVSERRPGLWSRWPVWAATGVMAIVCTLALANTASAQHGARSWAFKSIRPTSGPWGALVTLRGYGFSKSVRVFYNGKKVKPVSVGGSYIRVRVPKGARSGWFAVKHQGRTLRAPTKFKVVNPPKIAELVPDSGPPNTWVTVKGKHLRKGIRFWVGRSPVKRRYVNAGEVRLFVHRGIRSGRLSYRWKGKKHRTRLSFKVTEFPTVRGFRPKQAWHGDVVTIKGTNFCSNAKVALDGQPLEIVGKVRPRMIRFRVKKDASTGRIVVKCFGRTFKAPGRLSIEPPYAEVEKISPKGATPGSWVVIEGKGLRRSDKFWIGRTAVKQTKHVSPQRVRAKIPARARSGVLYFESFGKRFSSSKRIDVYRKPTIRGIAPARGWYGEEVTIKGRNFCADMDVRLRGKKVRVLKRKGSSQVVVRVPRNARPGRFTVSCLRWKVSADKPFRLVPPKSAVKKITPLSGPPGTKITVIGRNLRKSDAFMLNGKVMPMDYKGPTRVRLVVPKGASSGKIIHKSYGRKKATRFAFKVAWSRPIVATYRPKTAWYGDVVTLTGRRICPSPKVTLQGEKLKVLESTGSNIKVRVPNEAESGNFVVRCSKHRVTVRPAIKIKPPYAQVFSIHPDSGPPGTWVTLTGDSFKRSDRFYLGKKPLKRRYVGSHQVKVRIPKGAKSAKIVMKSAGHRVVTKHEFDVAFPTPVVRDFSPRSGWYGETIEVKGSRFCINPKVYFEGTGQAKVLSRLGPSALKVKVPRNAQTGAIKVECYGKTGRSSRYFVLSPPLAHVSQVTPDRGKWNRWITIIGRNFTPKTKFYLGRTRLKMDYKSKNKVRVFIPPGAKSGLIYVESFGRKKDSSFTYVVKKKKKKPRR
jgi:hypothetical protein